MNILKYLFRLQTIFLAHALFGQSEYDKLLENYLLLAHKTAQVRMANHGVCASNIENYFQDPSTIKTLSTQQKEDIINQMGPESHQYPCGLIQCYYFENQESKKPIDLCQQKNPHEIMLSLHLLFTINEQTAPEVIKNHVWHASQEANQRSFEKLNKHDHEKAHRKWAKMIDHLKPIH